MLYEELISCVKPKDADNWRKMLILAPQRSTLHQLRSELREAMSDIVVFSIAPNIESIQRAHLSLIRDLTNINKQLSKLSKKK